MAKAILSPFKPQKGNQWSNLSVNWFGTNTGSFKSEKNSFFLIGGFFLSFLSFYSGYTFFISFLSFLI